MKITLETLQPLDICYEPDRVSELVGDGLTIDQAMALDIPDADKIYVGVQLPMLSVCSRRLYACDCAERVLHIYESSHPGDTRPREAIAASRKYARGEISRAELGAAEMAAWAAADEAYEDEVLAAADAAWAAAWAADPAADAGARWAAMRAEDASQMAAECKWQVERLAQYLRGEVA